MAEDLWLPPGEMPLVHAGQTLRLCLRQCLPSEVQNGEWFPISVGCRNEFGLWKRDEFPCSNRVPLALEVLSLEGQPLEHRMEVDGVMDMEASGKLNFAVRLWLTEVTGAFLLRLKVARDFEALQRPLLPVLSPPLRGSFASQGAAAIDLPHPGHLTLEQCRLIDVPGGHSLLCAECQGDLGIGGRLWDGALVLLEYLAESWQPGTYLELGSGTGLVGLSCALWGAEVCLSDLPDVTALLHFNVALNQARGLELDVQVIPHEWGTELPPDLAKSEKSLDVVVMADLVYDVEASRQLLVTLIALAAVHHQLQFVMAFRPRNVEDPEFFRELSKHFDLAPQRSSGVYGQMCYDVQILRLTAKGKTDKDLFDCHPKSG